MNCQHVQYNKLSRPARNPVDWCQFVPLKPIPLAKDKTSVSAPFKASLIKAVLKIFAALPLSVSARSGRALGHVVWWLKGKAVKTTHTNLAICYPHLSERARHALAKTSIVTSGQLISELGPVWLWPNDRLENLILDADGAERVAATLSAGRGVLLTGPHTGNWEFLSWFMARRFGYTAMYRKPRIAELDELLVEARNRAGANLVPGDRHGLKKMMTALRQGGVVALLADQEPGRNAGVFAPFFGEPAYTMTLVQKLLQKSGAELFDMCAYRCDYRHGFSVRFRELPIDPDLPETEFATAMNLRFEEMIRMAPEQYEWAYKRFKSRPEGARKVY